MNDDFDAVLTLPDRILGIYRAARTIFVHDLGETLLYVCSSVPIGGGFRWNSNPENNEAPPTGIAPDFFP